MKEYLVSDLPRRFFSSDDRETRLNEFISYCLDKALIEAINKIQIFKDCPPNFMNSADITNNGDGTVTLKAPLYIGADVIADMMLEFVFDISKFDDEDDPMIIWNEKYTLYTIARGDIIEEE